MVLCGASPPIYSWRLQSCSEALIPGCGNPSGGWNQERSSGLNWDVLLIPVRTREVLAAGASSVGPLIHNKPASLQDHLPPFVAVSKYLLLEL